SWLARHRQFQGLAWLPRVEPADRKAFEARYPTILGKGLRIREIAGGGPLGASHASGPSYPVAWIEPFRGNERALGVDIGSETHRRAALEEAVETDSVRVTRGIALVQDPVGVWSHLIYVPIRGKSGRVEGLVDGVVKVPRIFDAAGREVSLTMDVEVVDISGTEPLRMGTYRSSTHRWDPPVGKVRAADAVRRTTMVGHRYELRLYSTPAFEGRVSANKAPYVAAIGVLLAAWVGSSLRRAEQRAREWRRRTDHDDLTGALARGRLDRVIALAATDSRRENRPMALLMVDIDHFKAINDNYGHPMGDTVLRQVAALLAAGLRDGDQLGRYGGEEFAVVLPRADAEAARECAERIRRRVEETSFGEPGGPLRLTVSIGLAARVGAEPSALVSAADEALYRAKRSGRNRVIIATA
ncbi:MAG: diguanylate cyclase, partial [Armatimonadota bacterium]